MAQSGNLFKMLLQHIKGKEVSPPNGKPGGFLGINKNTLESGAIGSNLASGGKVRGYGKARGAKKCKVC